MIAIDTNILIYAFNPSDPHHHAGRASLEEVAASDVAWGLPVFVIGEFLRIVTNRRGPMPRPTTAPQAMASVDNLLASPSAKVLAPGRRYLPLLRGILGTSGPRGNEVFDAQIAAVCLEHGATTILTNDAGFGRFSGITVKAML